MKKGRAIVFARPKYRDIPTHQDGRTAAPLKGQGSTAILIQIIRPQAQAANVAHPFLPLA
jgi:hypothetical protein